MHGLVQGVFFRDSCRREAQAAGVGGWVRNRPDGTVEALFEGPEDDVERMLDWVRHGPAYARVERVDVVEEPPSGHTGFVVTR
ncbi:acylphosphatase [Kribbella sp. VKM Ac-2527]|uniref:acylphosphatase n=1 Tax=Kribbella caucasensis TaxID=2512215 RepID=A0A4R6K723_9ACTN|nr:acylphosphatase [Kribbella sp. VKM Ac-2527]